MVKCCYYRIRDLLVECYQKGKRGTTSEQLIERLIVLSQDTFKVEALSSTELWVRDTESKEEFILPVPLLDDSEH
jgi:hypothetical protein